MVTEDEKAQTKATMDAAAEVAKQEFMDEILVNRGDWKAVARWAVKHYPKAGYKRLGKVLVDMGKTLPVEAPAESES